MKFSWTKSALAVVLVSFICLVGCQDDQTTTFFRDTDELSFDYLQSTKFITVRTNGQWRISAADKWVSFSKESGTGDGVRRDTVYVTLDRNKTDVRETEITLSGNGKTYPISVTQESGVMLWGDMSIAGALKYNIAIEDTFIAIPYYKANGEKLIFNITPSGIGAAGVNAVSNYNVTLNEGDGVVEIPLSGTPTVEGRIEFAIDFTMAEGGAWDGPALGSSLVSKIGEKKIYLDMKFDMFPNWGYEYISQTPGMRPTTAAAAVTINDTPDQAATAELNDGHASGLTSSIRKVNVPFMQSIGIGDWTGSNNYLRPGYVRVGHQTNQPGYIITPKLSKIPSVAGGVPVKLIFDVCPDVNANYPQYGMQVLVVENYAPESSVGVSINPWTGKDAQDKAGTVWYDFKGNEITSADINSDAFNQASENYFAMDKKRVWQRKTITIQRVTPNTQLIFCVNGYHYAKGEKTFFFLDNIVVEELEQ